MKAFITSIGERTTDLSKWSLERNGYDVFVVKHAGSKLWEKLKWIYENVDEDFLRVDADVVPNRRLTPDTALLLFRDYPDAWWLQFKCFDWFQQLPMYGGIQLIRKEALPALRRNVANTRFVERPESYLYRLAEFHNPRRCISVEEVAGIHGYAQDNVERVKAVKRERNQEANYDFELAERLSQLGEERR